MNRNTENHFAETPVIQRERSTFTNIFNHKTSFNLGQIIPFFVDQNVMPGDTYKLSTSVVIRTTTPKLPVMDQLVADIYYFKDEKRNLWGHWVNLMGENTAGAWAPTVEYSEPQIVAPTGGWAPKTLMDYMGVTPGIEISVSALPVRSYIRIFNYWFRDQNYQAPITENTGDADTQGSTTNSWEGGHPRNAMKTHDYFTSVLPAPQKSLTPPTLPLGTSAPVKFSGSKTADSAYSMHFTTVDGTDIGTTGSQHNILGALYNNSTNAGNVKIGTGTGDTPADPANAKNIYINNAYADLTAATAATINALRFAVASQIILEGDSRYGTRYPEVIRGHFSTIAPSLAVFQKPEYLGGRRIALDMEQIAQTSSTDSTSPQGHLSAFSLTTDINEDVFKSFTEHSILMGLIVVRIANHTYQQGIGKQWFRKRRLDYYWPELRNIGEQPVLNKYIYATGTSTDNEVFGYQEAWAEYRYYPNRTSGEMRSTYTTPLDAWHYADKYDSLPIAGGNFLTEKPEYIDRTLAVSHNVSNQFLADIAVKVQVTRAMPLYSVPGLMDHF